MLGGYRMKIAALTGGSYPTILGRNARLIRLIEPMSKDNDVHIFSFGSFVNENNDCKADNFYIHKVKLPLTMPTAKLLFSGITKNYLFGRMKKFGEFDAIYSYYITPWAYLALSASKRFSIPLFSDYPDLEVYENSNIISNLIYRTITTNILENVFKNSMHIFPISKPLKDRLIKLYNIPEERITVIPNGVNTDIFNPMIEGSKIRSKFGLSDSFIIGYSGSLREWIRIDVLFKAFMQIKKDYKNVKLLIVGGRDVDRTKWEKLSKELEIEDDVTFTGVVPYKEVPEYIAAFDIAISIFSKSLFSDVVSPLKVMEYMGMGKAVVADALSGTREFIKNNENGILFVLEDKKSLENAIRTILDDEYLKRKLEINARETALNYEWGVLSKRIVEIMRDKIGLVE